MAASEDHRAPHEIIEAERIAYFDTLPRPTWTGRPTCASCTKTSSTTSSTSTF